MTDLAQGRVALVTGGSRGIGRSIATRLAASGLHVAVNYSSNEAAADEVVGSITDEGGTAAAYGADVSDTAQVEEMFDANRDAPMMNHPALRPARK